MKQTIQAISSLKYRSGFIVLLICGPFALLPFLMLMPTMCVARSCWRTNFWPLRLLLVGSIAAAFSLTCPSSPVFIGLDVPVSTALFSPELNLQMGDILRTQCRFCNAAIIAAGVMLPVSAMHAVYQRRRQRALLLKSPSQF